MTIVNSWHKFRDADPIVLVIAAINLKIKIILLSAIFRMKKFLLSNEFARNLVKKMK